ncbi:MAG: dTDP-4-dehydrorhamnose reductase [Maribacter sp.]|uniref:dTDP-4-dehydrorhamnose reductase n=1 Tax=Maribacter sp. TaxID=1897614 RepID=UPI003C7262B8
MLNILVTGGNGQLARCIKDASSKYPNALTFSFRSSSELNIADIAAVHKEFEMGGYHYCINTAAYTNVDGAEQDTELAHMINHRGAKNLAIACDTYNTVLIHISTDFVFDGTQNVPYTEMDPTNALGTYGSSKLMGEQAIASICKKYFIIRTSWLYSEYGSNFLKSMLQYGREREELSVVFDQIGTPTYAMDLAEVLLLFIQDKVADYGVYHYSNEGVASWYDFAKAIFDINGISVQLNPIRSDAYPRPAKRPSYSVLDKTKIKKTLQIDIPYWQDSLIKASKALK